MSIGEATLEGESGTVTFKMATREPIVLNVELVLKGGTHMTLVHSIGYMVLGGQFRDFGSWA